MSSCDILFSQFSFPAQYSIVNFPMESHLLRFREVILLVEYGYFASMGVVRINCDSRNFHFISRLQGKNPFEPFLINNPFFHQRLGKKSNFWNWNSNGLCIYLIVTDACISTYCNCSRCTMNTTTFFHSENLCWHTNLIGVRAFVCRVF